jgi:Short C-terminal domain
MATKIIALKTDINTAFAQISQSLTNNKAEITSQQAPKALTFSMAYSSFWTSFMKVKLEGQVALERTPDGQTVAHIEINPAQNAVLGNVGIQGVLGVAIGFLFLGPLAILIAPLASAGLYPYLNNAMPDQALGKLGQTLPSEGLSSTPVTAMANPNVNHAQSEVFAQLRSLGELRDAGVLSGEEFETKKTDLLARV